MTPDRLSPHADTAALATPIPAAPPPPLTDAPVLPRTVRDAACVLALTLTDLGSCFAAVALAWPLRDALSRWIPLQELTVITWLDLAQLLSVAVVGGFFLRGLYLRRDPFWENLRLTLQTLVLSLGLALAVLYLTNIVGGIPRTMAALCGAATLALVPAARFTTLRLLQATGLWSRRAAVLGRPPHAAALADDLRSDFALGYRIVAVIDPDTHPAFRLPPRLDEVVVAGAGLDPDAAARLVSDLHRRAPAVTLVPDLGPLPYVSGMTRFLFDQRRVLLTTRNLLQDPANLLVKRLFDLVVSLLLLIPALPILLLTALAIRLTSRGPAVFVDRRVGRHGKLFPCLKFRTMHHDARERLDRVLASDPDLRAEWDRFQKLRSDPRVTPLGAFLRRTSLDELPQLLNVLAGQMSLVGPRPLPEYHYEKFEEPYRSDYLEVLPGITGLWQVSGRSEADVQRMAQLNSWYARNWSLWLDVTLLLRTGPAVMKFRGAY